MDKQFVWDPPFKGKRPLTVNTCCVVGVCTCIMIKIAVEKVLDGLGVDDYDVRPSVEDNPRGDRSKDPDLLVLEGTRIEEIKRQCPQSICVELKDLAKQDLLLEDMINAFLEVGWLKEM